VTFVLALFDRDRGKEETEAGPGPTLGRVTVLGLGGALVVLGLWRLLFWRLLFLPVEGHPSLERPRFWLMLPGIILALAAFPLAAVFYRSSQQADRQDGPKRSLLEPAWLGAVSILVACVLGFGLWVGLKFKRVYLDYWPADPKLTSFRSGRVKRAPDSPAQRLGIESIDVSSAGPRR